ncbi:MAG: response regulator [Calditrichaceae bacterium]
MGTKYKRVKNVEEKIHSAKLPYNAWRVFFLIDGSVGSEQIAEYLEDEPSVAEDALQRLISEGLVEAEGAEEVKEQVEEPLVEEAQEEKEPEKEEEPEIELQTEDVETEESLEFDLDEETEETKEEPVVEEEMADTNEDLADDILSVVEDEEVSEESVVEDETDFSLDNLDLDETSEMEADAAVETDAEEDVEVDTELEAEQETVEEETLEIDLQDMEDKEEEAESADLDIDFSEEQPVEEAKKEEPEPEKEEPEGPSPEELADMKTILVVDDSIVIRKMVEIALEDENYKIETAVSGKDGLAILDDKNPSLMILDLMLPDINGIDLLKTVKASKGIPVIMLSGKDSPQMVEKARSEGADAFLPKPFKDDELVSKIRELLG